MAAIQAATLEAARIGSPEPNATGSPQNSGPKLASSKGLDGTEKSAAGHEVEPHHTRTALNTTADKENQDDQGI
ncbi:MAG TPA: hypothetical protein VEG34_02975 [Thermoanaerobaculia bacterium]|nr:hypothetical protein [Thermoanaerobaculia bacterium]